MKLEKATSHSSDASLAGWISSNDVTLLTMVLVVMIALFRCVDSLLRPFRKNEHLFIRSDLFHEFVRKLKKGEFRRNTWQG